MDTAPRGRAPLFTHVDRTGGKVEVVRESGSDGGVVLCVPHSFASVPADRLRDLRDALTDEIERAIREQVASGERKIAAMRAQGGDAR